MTGGNNLRDARARAGDLFIEEALSKILEQCSISSLSPKFEAFGISQPDIWSKEQCVSDAVFAFI